MLSISSHRLAEKLGELIRSERKITKEILNLINQALDQRSYLDLGFPSMFEWLTKGFGYSNAAAYRRIEAARLLRSLSEDSKIEIEEKIEKGQVNLTTLSKIQSTIKAQEKVSGKKVSLALKQEVLKKISGSTRDDGNQDRYNEEETQKILFQILPEAQTEILQDRRKVISEDLTRHSITFTKEMSEDLKRVKEALSHICPKGSDQEVIAYALKFLLKKKDPANHKPSLKKRVPMKHNSLTQIASAAEADRVKTRSEIKGQYRGNIQNKINSETDFRSPSASCVYKDLKTGKVCGSRYQLQIDHIIPKALGGTDDPNNLRSLCRAHNIHAAEKIFGKTHMMKYRKDENQGLGPDPNQKS